MSTGRRPMVWVVGGAREEAAAVGAALGDVDWRELAAPEVVDRVGVGEAPDLLVLAWDVGAVPNAAQVCHAIRLKRDEVGLPILVIGGDAESVAAAGGNDVVARPLHAAELRARVRTLVRLAEAERERGKLTAVVHQSLVATAILEGPDHTFTLANSAYLALVERQDIVGKPLLQALPDIRGQGFDVLLDRVLATGEPFRGFEVPVKLAHHTGEETLFLNILYEPKRGADGRADGILVSAVDVTEQVVARRAAEANALALQTNEDRLRRVVEASGAGLWELDAATGILEADRRTLTLMAASTNRGMTLTSGLGTIVPDDRDRVAAAVASALAGDAGGQFHVEFRTGGAAGEPVRWVESRATVRSDSEGIARGLAGAMIDISSRKEAEAARESWLEALSAQPMLRVCVLRGPDLVFEMANGIYNEQVGRGRAILGKPLLEVIPELTGQPQIERLREVLATGVPYVNTETTTLLATESGELETVHFSLVYQPVRGASGNVESVLALAHDITANVRARAALEKAVLTAEAASLAKDEFLATASHELRTPLNAILGWARMLRSGNLDPSAYLRGVETIERNAKAQVQLIEDILDGSRIITGKLHLEIRPLDMTALVRAALDAVRPAAEAKGIAITLELEPAAARILGDPERLQQVVWNLANNAVKFTAKGGAVDIRLERVGTFVQLMVADTGQGIPLDFLPHVFDRFRQAEGSTTRRHGGLGLGLALVRHLVEAHGGTVRAESGGVGHGAQFVVLLPVQAVFEEARDSEHPRAAVEQATAFLPTNLAEVHALVVDDEADARELVATVLRANGAEVTTAASAAEALRLLATISPTVLISDVGMPEVDGYELIRRARRTLGAKGAELPAIALTAYSREQDRRLALEAGFQTHVAKPVEPAELVRVVAGLTHFIGRQATPVERGAALDKADTFLKLQKIVTEQGIHEALLFLNSRTSHRFTGIYRFDGDILRNVHLVDSYAADVRKGDDAPIADTYCSLVGESERAFTTEDTRVDDRLRTHPARDTVISYCGILLRDRNGNAFGSLCHFDLVPSDIPVAEVPLMEAAAPLLMRAVEGPEDATGDDAT